MGAKKTGGEMSWVKKIREGNCPVVKRREGLSGVEKDGRGAVLVRRKTGGIVWVQKRREEKCPG